MRRATVACVVLAVALAGCSSGGPTRAVVAGSPASVDASAAEATEYERVGTVNHTLNTTVRASISGDVQLDAERPVTATTPVTTYRRGTDAGPALVAVASAPAVRPIENQPVVRDPLATLSPAALAGYLQSTYEVDELSRTGNLSVRVLGNETTARTYEGTGRRGERSVPLRVTVVSARHGGGFVTVVSVAPRAASDGERFQRLLSGVNH